MGATSVSGRRARRPARDHHGTPFERCAIAPAEAAWIAAVPCAVLTVAAILLLASPLGQLLFPRRHYDFLQAIAPVVALEPREHAAFLLAIAGVVTLCLAVAGAARRPPQLAPAVSRRLVMASQLVLGAFLVTAFVGQRTAVFGSSYGFRGPRHFVYFTWPTIAVAAALAAAVPLALRSRSARPRLAAALRETRTRRVAALACAGGFLVLWLLTALNLDSSVGNVNRAVFDMLPWSMDETYAILDGLTPLVDFHAQYGQLWPYLVATAMHVAGSGLGVYTGAMATIAGAAMLAVFALLRRVTRSSLAALALFLPFVATSFFVESGPLDDRYGPANLFTIFPVRYAGPYLLAWLLARRLDGAWPRRTPLLFLFAGLVALNNPEFGVPAVGATLVACACARPPTSPRALARLLGGAALGMLGALALVTLLTFVRSGSAPHLGLLFEFARLYAVSGWAMLPMPTLGFHLVVFATFAGALVLAVVRASAREHDVVMTGMLAWTGAFGIGAGAYYVGRSHPDVLIDLFSAWALAVALLTVVAVRAMARRPSGSPRVVELAVLFALGLAVCSIAQTPTPWSQLKRLGDDTPVPAFRANALTRFLAHETHRGEHVAIYNLAGHRMAYDLGIQNVLPYASTESIVTRHQIAETVRALRAAGGRKIFLPIGDTSPEVPAMLQDDGFAIAHVDRASDTALLISRQAPRSAGEDAR
ncbi:MAG: hypothetical protein ACTHOE_16080 [Conexibacter sp.]